MIECEFRFNLLKEYSQINNSNYIFVAEDATTSIPCIDYDAQSNSFIGFSSPPLVNENKNIRVFCGLFVYN